MASALQPALDAVIAKLTAITPTTDPLVLFVRRGKEKLPGSTKAARRLFDVDFEGHGAERPAGPASRVARFRLTIDYPVGNAERELETVLAEDSEAVVRALTALGAWSSSVPGQRTNVLRVIPSTSVNREQETAQQGLGPGLVQLVVTAEVAYHDTVI